MKKIFKIINTIFLILYASPIFSQTYIIIPQKGIEGVPIVIDSSKILDVIEKYGTDYKLVDVKFHKVIDSFVKLHFSFL